MAEPSSKLVRVVQRIDRFTVVSGTWIAWLNVPLVLIVTWEVVARYGFDAPTTWAFDMTYMLYGAIFMLGSAYALQRGAHIRTDFFFERWSVRTRGVIDSVAYVLFFFTSLALLFAVGAQEAWYAFIMGETSEQTPWRPLLWPLKAVVPLTCVLLIVQGVSETIKSVYAARTGIELDHKEKIEI